MNQEESRALAFYQECTARQTTKIVQDDFWSAVVLQFSILEPAVKHGLLALSTLHEHSVLNQLTSRQSKKTEFAFRQYNLAIICAQNLVGRAGSAVDPLERLKVLIICALLTCYENIVGNYQRARMHLQTAIRLLRCEKFTSSGNNRNELLHPTRRSNDLIAVEDKLFLLDFQAMTFSDESAPYPHLIGQGDDIGGSPECLVDPSSTSEALSSLISILRFIFHLSVQAVATPISAFDLQLQKNLLTARLHNWTTFFAPLLNARSDAHTELNDNIQAITLLRIYHHMATILLAAAFSSSETSWDAHTTAFSSILDLAASLISTPSLRSLPKSSTTPSMSSATPAPSDPFTFNIGIIVPLFLLAFRCRHPILRRRAVDLLSREDRREGVWSSQAAAEVAKVIIRIEEEGLTRVTDEGDVGDGNRVRTIFTRVLLDEDGKGKIWMRVLRQPNGVGGEWEGKEYWVWI